MDSVPFGISPDPDSNLVVVENAIQSDSDARPSVSNVVTRTMEPVANLRTPSAAEGSTHNSVTGQSLCSQQGVIRVPSLVFAAKGEYHVRHFCELHQISAAFSVTASAYIQKCTEPATSEEGGDVRMASSTHGSVSLNGGHGGGAVNSIVNQLKENNFPMV